LDVDAVRARVSDQPELRQRSQDLPVKHGAVANGNRHLCRAQALEQRVAIRRNFAMDLEIRGAVETKKFAGFLKRAVHVVAYNDLDQFYFQPPVRSSIRLCPA